jgi:uncharacterized repeat protein (TIGR03943 family)
VTVNTERLTVRQVAARVDLQRFLPAFILAGYGLFILSLFVRHVMTWYINPTYVAPTTVAGAILVGLAATRLGKGSTAACSADACGCHDGCDHDASPARLWTYAILAVPLLLAALFPPRGLAAFSANQRGTAIAGLTTFHGATVKRIDLTVDTSSFSMEDWVGALSADPNPKDYLSKPVQVTGIVIHNVASVPPDYIMVIRYFVTCCIADARPVGLIVRDTSNGRLQDNQWVTVKGVMARDHYEGQDLAVVQPRVLAITKAGNPYIY